jgi:hypothetical protein
MGVAGIWVCQRDYISGGPNYSEQEFRECISHSIFWKQIDPYFL